MDVKQNANRVTPDNQGTPVSPELKGNEQALLTAIVEGSDDAIISKNLNGIITSWNQGAEKVFGYTSGEAVGQPVTTLIPAHLVDEEDMILEKIRNGEKVNHYETIRQRKDGTLIDVSLTISPVRNREGIIVGASKIARDITQQKEAERKLEKLNKNLEARVEERTDSLISYQEQLRSLATKLSQAEEQERHRLATELHDNLGQMLAVGKMKMDLLAQEELSRKAAAGLEEIQQVMDDALVYTRELMSDLKPPPSLDKEDVRDSIQWVANKMEKHDLTVRVIDDSKPKKVTNNIRTTLLQSVRELLFNVIKHARVNEATVRMTTPDGYVKIVVEDEGEGFDSSAEERTSTRDGGFGLFNIKERIDLIGGNVAIDSLPGIGTKIILTAPLKEQGNSEAVAEPEETDSPSGTLGDGKKIRVLLVDDHKMMREGLRKIVNEEEDLIVVAEAANGQEAIEKARETEPDIIVMDVNMPVMDGITATQKITSDGNTQRIIGLSLHDHERVIESMRSAGATAYLTKNEAFETLCATIRSEANLDNP